MQVHLICQSNQSKMNAFTKFVNSFLLILNAFEYIHPKSFKFFLKDKVINVSFRESKVITENYPLTIIIFFAEAAKKME